MKKHGRSPQGIQTTTRRGQQPRGPSLAYAYSGRLIARLPQLTGSSSQLVAASSTVFVEGLLRMRAKQTSEKMAGDRRKAGWGQQIAGVNLFAAEIATNKAKRHFVTWPDVKVRYFKFCVERVGLAEQKTTLST